MKILLSFLLLIYTFEIHSLEKNLPPKGSDLAYWIAIKKAKAQEGYFINPIGASEYIVKPHSEVFVLSITPIEEYCR